MIKGDTSPRTSVAFEGDTCDAFEANGDTWDAFGSEGDTPGSPCGTESPDAGKQGDSCAFPGVARGAITRRSRGASRLLDRTLAGETPKHEAKGEGPDAEALDRCLRWIVLGCIAPTLEAARPAALHLVALTLTAPDVETIDEAARSFAHMSVDHPLGGALLSRDRGAERGRAHYHGIALVLSTGLLRGHWAEFAGRSALEPVIKHLTHWRTFCAEPYERRFAPNLLRVVQYYVTKPWPERYGRRSLDRDMFASGAFEAPLRAIRTAAAGGVTLWGQSPVEASPTRRICLRCGKPLPVGCRRSMKRHGPCRRAASRAKRKADRAEERKRASDPFEGAR